MNSFLASRSEAAAANEEWSRRELGEWLGVLDVGCALLDTAAREVAEHVLSRGSEASQSEEAISLLSMWAVSRAGSACTLLLQGFPTDAGALMRALMEVEAVQTLLATDPESADMWMRNEELQVGEFLKVVTKQDRSFGQEWGSLGTVVHPNRRAVINQVDELGGGARLGGGGARRPEQLHKLTANFGVQVKRELHLLERTFEHLSWSAALRTLIEKYELLLDQMHEAVLGRWPSSETMD